MILRRGLVMRLRWCWCLEGLKTTQKRQGWSARTGKIVLYIALIGSGRDRGAGTAAAKTPHQPAAYFVENDIYQEVERKTPWISHYVLRGPAGVGACISVAGSKVVIVMLAGLCRSKNRPFRSPRYLALTAALTLCGMAASADPQGRFYFDSFAGIMTGNRFEEVFDPSRLEFIDSGLVGIGIGWERQIADSRFHFGVQFQAVGHTGRQDHLEFNLPLVIRYVPRRPWPPGLKSAAFGLGLSHATKVPLVEVDHKGVSRRNLVYWLADIEVELPRSDASLFFRLHHRSDAYGLFKDGSGSNALVIGWRKAL